MILQFLSPTLLLTLGFACLSNMALAQNRDQPNVLIILADDLGYGDVSAFNPDSKIPTPNLDQLAAEGLALTDFHTNSAVCTPTRYGLLTGRYAWRSRLKKGVIYPPASLLIEEDIDTIARLVGRHDYRTAAIGKWHLGNNWTFDGEGQGIDHIDFSGPAPGGLEAGFAHTELIPASLDMPPYVWLNDGQAEELPTERQPQVGGQPFLRAGVRSPSFHPVNILGEIGTRSASWIEHAAKDDEPWLLYVPLTSPHKPILPAPEWRGRSGIGAWGDFVAQTDGVIGQILEALEASDQADNTLVFFASDNGPTPGADFDALAKLGHDPRGGWRGSKADLFEGGHRVPAILRWPGQIDPATRSDALCGTIDLYATLVQILDPSAPLDAHHGADSYDMSPIWTDGQQGDTLSGRPALIYHSIDGSFGLRVGDQIFLDASGSGGWSLPNANANQQGFPPIQLYELSTDPSQQHNLQANQADRLSELRALLEQIQNDPSHDLD